MRLPHEIRHRVLSLLLKQKDELTQNTVNSIAPEQGCRNPHKLWPVDVHVFAVCQQMRLEAEKVFYEQNTFHVDATGSLPLFVRKAVEDKTPGSILGLRRIHIRIPYERRGCHVMRQSQEERLEKLEILSDFLVKCRNLR